MSPLQRHKVQLNPPKVGSAPQTWKLSHFVPLKPRVVEECFIDPVTFGSHLKYKYDEDIKSLRMVEGISCMPGGWCMLTDAPCDPNWIRIISPDGVVTTCGDGDATFADGVGQVSIASVSRTGQRVRVCHQATTKLLPFTLTCAPL